MVRIALPSLCVLATLSLPHTALAVTSGELYTSAAYGYGRYEARLKFAAGDGIVSSFFLWKDGSEVSGTFWNELDFEKLGADCHVETNAIYGNPPGNNSQRASAPADPCGSYHVYAYEWTPEAIVWKVDGVEIRRDTGQAATAFAQNAAAAGMQVRFNVWPGDETFGGNFNPNVLPVHQYVDWVQFSAYENGAFVVKWREDFDSTALPSGWLTASWMSPKNRSTHDARNVNVIDGHLTLSLTSDDAIGPNGAMHGDTSGGAPSGGAPGAGGTAGPGAGSAGAPGSGGAGAPASGGAAPAGAPGTAGGGTASATGGSPASSGGAATGGQPASTGGQSGVATPTGGTSTGGSSGGTSPAGPSGGTSPIPPPAQGGSVPASPPPQSAPEDGGCSWVAAGSTGAGGPLGAVGLAALWMLRRRRVRAS